MAQLTDLVSMRRDSGTRPPALPSTVSTVTAAHAGLVARLASLKPNTIRYVADQADVEERAEHLQDLLAAMSDYVSNIVRDTAQNLPVGLIDHRYMLERFSDAIGDVVAGIANAADRVDVVA